MNRCGSHVGRWTLIGGVLLLAVAGRAHGGVGRWTALGGTSGGKVNWMAVDPADPRRLFAVTDAAGLFRSTNGGMTWEPAPGLPSKTRGYVVAIDPRRPRTVYVGLGPAQAWKSVDGGDSWTPLAGGPFDGQLLSLTFAPRHPRTVYALSYGASKLRVFRSADGGTTWGARGVFSGGQSYGLTPIVVSPFDANMLLLDALFSTDGGLSWTFLSPNAMTGDTLHRVLFEPLQSGVVLYAAVNVGIFRSADGGRTWTEVTPGHATAYYLVENMAFSFDGRTLFVVASGPSGTILQESDDGGLHWTPSTAPAPFGLGQFLEGSIIADPAGGERLYATTQWGVYWSADGGNTWESRTDGLVAGGVIDLVADAGLPGTFYAVNKTPGPESLRADHGALSRSRDGGLTWHFLRGEIEDPLSPDPVHAGSFYSGLLRFTNEGEIWTPFPFPFSLYCLTTAQMVADPVAPSTLYLLMQSYIGYGCHFGDLGLVKSSDGGSTWESLATAPVVANLAIGAPRRTLYGQTYAGAARSDDGGKTWTESNLGLPPGLVIDSFSLSQDTGWLYLTGYGIGEEQRSVFRSEDGTRTWQRVAPSPLGPAGPIDQPFTVVANPHVATTVYGYGNGRFFRSLDGGASWTEHSAGLRGFELTGPLLVDPHRPGVVLAGTASGVVIAAELPTSPQ